MGKHCIKYLRWHKMLFMIDLHENIFFSCLKISHYCYQQKLYLKKYTELLYHFLGFQWNGMFNKDRKKAEKATEYAKQLQVNNSSSVCFTTN